MQKTKFLQKFIKYKYSTFSIIILTTLFFLINWWTPTWGDDWWRSELPSNFLHIFERLANEYMTWTGRLSVLFTTYIMMLNYSANMIVFATANTIVMILAIWFMARLSIKEKSDLHFAIALLLGFALLWLLTSAFGEAVLWKTGAIAYFWSSTIALILVERFINPRPFHSKVVAILYIVIALWVGNALENLSVSLVLLFIILFIIDSKTRIFSNLIVFLSLTVGSIVLIVAPGNYVRFARQDSGESIFERFFPLLKRIWEVESSETFSLYILAFILMTLAVTGIKIKERSIFIFGLLAILTAITMVGSTGINYGERTTFVTQFFIIMIILNLIMQGLNSWSYRGKWLLPLGIISIFAVSLILHIPQYLSVHKQYQERLELMKYYKEDNLKRIYIPSMKIPTRKGLKDDIVDGAFFLRDLHGDIAGNGWRNSTFAKYHGFEFATRLNKPHLIYLPILTKQLLSKEYKTIKREENLWIGKSVSGKVIVLDTEHRYPNCRKMSVLVDGVTLKLNALYDTHIISNENKVVTSKYCFYRYEKL